MSGYGISRYRKGFSMQKECLWGQLKTSLFFIRNSLHITHRCERDDRKTRELEKQIAQQIMAILEKLCVAILMEVDTLLMFWAFQTAIIKTFFTLPKNLFHYLNISLKLIQTRVKRFLITVWAVVQRELRVWILIEISSVWNWTKNILKLRKKE